MKTRKFSARWTGFSARLSYANVMATLAFFMALGGGAYAATQINGKQIKKHTIPANRLVRGAVVPRAALANRVEHLLISKGRRNHHGRGHAADVGSAAPSTVVSLSVGQSVPVFQSGPFTITARCVDEGSGVFRIALDGSATEDWYPIGGGVVNAGGTYHLYSSETSQPYFAVNTGTASMFGADGQSLVLGTWSITTHLGGDCTFSGSAVGG